MKIGFFGGAFNPVHNGHLHLIKTLIHMPLYPDMKCVDKLIVIPTANPPHRSGKGLASGYDRINMLSLAIEEEKAEISDIEFHMKGKNYTYNTLKQLKKIYPEDEFYLFMGSDQLLNFKSWYKYEKILELSAVVAVSRSKEDNEKVEKFLIKNTDLGASSVVYEPVEVSSTEIRQKIKNGKSIAGLVPEDVKNYIKEHRLYV